MLAITLAAAILYTPHQLNDATVEVLANLEAKPFTGPIYLGPVKPLEKPKPAQRATGVKPKTLLDTAKSLQGQYGGECVVFVRRLLGAHPDFHGYAGNIVPNATEPQIGYAVLTTEHGIAHAQVIVDMRDEYLIIADSNYSKHRDRIVRVGRELKITDQRIRGYFNFKIQ